MDIPDAFRWVLLALAGLQLLSLGVVLRRLRDAEPGQRTGARLELLDVISGVLLLGGLGFRSVPIGICGLTLMGAVIGTKGIRFLQARRQA